MKQNNKDNIPSSGSGDTAYNQPIRSGTLRTSPSALQCLVDSCEPTLKKSSFTGGTTTESYECPLQHHRRVANNTTLNKIHGPPSSKRRTSNVFQRPCPMAIRATGRHHGAVIAKTNDWSQWVELAVQFSGFPSYVTTKEVWAIFKEEGEILTIEIFDDNSGKPSGRGRVRFR